MSHEQLRAEYALLDKEVIKLNAERYACEISRRPLPQGIPGPRASDLTEKHLLLREISKQRKHIPVRQLVRRAGRALKALKPCFMMGPLSVAQYLEPGAIEFDLVVMDEASQVRPEEAIGAVARAKQLIVVGDPNQLPPTSFFDRLLDAGDSEREEEQDVVNPVAGIESILDICRQRYPMRTLRWHYRSRHESLIAFSNERFYRGGLIVFPAPFPRSRLLGVHYHHVPNGVYQSRQNVQEAVRVVDAVLHHMLNRSDESLGVVTLNLTQRDLIDELLDNRLRTFPEGERYKARWEKEGWPLFVKNLENVQGDERDVVFISTTFGPAPGTDKVRQNFGPISKRTGWRRLNVLFTRARKSVHIFSSMHPQDIVVDEATPEGTQALRAYLEYASTGVISRIAMDGREPDSDFEVAVADVLRTKGFEVVPQLGVAGYFIDMAVRNPFRCGEFLAAVECDGASYHSGVSVRDRDRIRQEILESLGWRGKIYRIWSTDWFRNPGRENAKLLAFLEGRLNTAQREPPGAVEEEVEPVPAEAAVGAGPVVDGGSQLLPVSAGEETYVEVGDLVTYFDVAEPDRRLTVRIVEGVANKEAGEVNENTPLARVLLGLEVGGQEILIVPPYPKRVLQVLKIERPKH